MDQMKSRNRRVMEAVVLIAMVRAGVRAEQNDLRLRWTLLRPRWRRRVRRLLVVCERCGESVTDRALGPKADRGWERQAGGFLGWDKG